MTTIEKVAKRYNRFMGVLPLVVGYTCVFWQSIHDEGVSSGIIQGIGLSILGTACLLIMPMVFILIGAATRILPILSIPYYTILVIGNLSGEHNDIGVAFLMKCITLSMWSVFNLYLWKVDSKRDMSLLVDGLTMNPFELFKSNI